MPKQGWGVLSVLCISTACARTLAVGSPEQLLPADGEVGGWVKQDAPKAYGHDNLYAYIDGAAEGYFAYDFRQLISARFKKQGAKEGTITVDIYDMERSENAFGIYSMNRSPDYRSVKVGREGYVANTTLDFWKDRYFIRLSASKVPESPEAVLMRFAKAAAQKITATGREARVLSFLPARGYVSKSAKWYLRDVLGQAFLERGVVADYVVNDTKCQLFLCEFNSPEAAAKSFENYRQYLLKQSKDLNGLIGLGEQAFAGPEPYNENVVIFRQKSFLGGMLHEPANGAARPLLREVSKRIARKRSD